jgi:hypothetical protein
MFSCGDLEDNTEVLLQCYNNVVWLYDNTPQKTNDGMPDEKSVAFCKSLAACEYDDTTLKQYVKVNFKSDALSKAQQSINSDINSKIKSSAAMKTGILNFGDNTKNVTKTEISTITTNILDFVQSSDGFVSAKQKLSMKGYTHTSMVTVESAQSIVNNHIQTNSVIQNSVSKIVQAIIQDTSSDNNGLGQLADLIDKLKTWMIRLFGGVLLLLILIKTYKIFIQTRPLYVVN